MTYTKKQLRDMWKRTPEEQINVTISKIIEAYRQTSGNIAISWSGGKDSTVMLYLSAQVWVSIYGDRPMVVIFCDTTNEHREIKQFIPIFLDWLKKETGVVIDYHRLRQPIGNDFVTVAREEGLPLISKQVSMTIRKLRKYLEKSCLTWSDVKRYHKYSDRRAVSELKDMGLCDTGVLALTGFATRYDCFTRSRFLPYRWAPIMDTDIPVSEICCQRLKKGIANTFLSGMGIHATMIGEMACDSQQRETSYLQTGCNNIMDGAGHSKPLGPMLEQTVLWYIESRQIPQSAYYGELCEIDGHRCFTRHQRGGCALCGFGIEHEPDRFAKLYDEDYAKCRIGFLPKTKGGLGYKEACEFLNNACGMHIEIPQIGG